MTVSSHPIRALGLTGLCLGAALVVLDAVIVNVAVPTVRRDLGGGADALLWVIDAYTLIFAALLLSGGALGDRVGRRRAFLSGLALFAVASLTCSLAPNIATLIGSRALQGVGAALLAPASLALISGLYPDPKERAHAVGVWAGVAGVAFASGPVIGGVLVHTVGWRSIFLVNIPVAAVAAALVIRHVLPSAPRPERFDPLGQLLAAGGLATVVAALVESSRRGWNPLIVIAVTVGVAMVVGFGVVEWLLERRSGSPMLPPSLLRPASMKAGLLTAAAFNFGLYGMLIVFSVLLQQQRHYSALDTGLAFLPLTIVGALASAFVGGQLIARYGARPTLTLGMSLACLGSIVLAFFTPGAPYLLAAAGFAVFGAGTGLSSPAQAALVLGAAPAALSGRASGVLNAARQVGGVIGVALLGSLTANRADHLFVAMLVAAAVFGVAALVTWARAKATPAFA